MGDPNKAGIPQPITRSGSPVGQFNAMGTDGTGILDMADGSRWLRGGLVLPSGPYAEAGKLRHLQAQLFSISASAALGNPVVSIATNGTGTFVALVQGDATNVYTSTDGGATWTARPHGTTRLSSIIFGGGKFVAVGNDAVKNIFCSTSADGVTWTGYTVATVNAGTADTADIAWNGTAYALMVPDNTTSAMRTSATALSGSWTTRTLPSPSTADGSRVAGGGLGFLCTSGSSATGFRSLDNGATWQTVTLGSNAVLNSKPMVGANFAAHWLNTTQVGYSTDLSTFVQASTSFGGGDLQNQSVVQGVNGRWCVPVTQGLIWSDDAINWTLNVCGLDAAGSSLQTLSSRLMCVGGTSVVSVNGSTKPQYSANSTPTKSNGVGGSSSVAGAWRIK